MAADSVNIIGKTFNNADTLNFRFIYIKSAKGLETFR